MLAATLLQRNWHVGDLEFDVQISGIVVMALSIIYMTYYGLWRQVGLDGPMAYGILLTYLGMSTVMSVVIGESYPVFAALLAGGALVVSTSMNTRGNSVVNRAVYLARNTIAIAIILVTNMAIFRGFWLAPGQTSIVIVVLFLAGALCVASLIAAPYEKPAPRRQPERRDPYDMFEGVHSDV
jgi:hypothetical protein